jgi:hypothetical protein
MTLIDAINDMLGYMGESPLDPTDADYTAHPLYESALRILNTTNEAVQSKGWWFNTTRRTLTPVSSAIAVPAGTLSLNVLAVYGDTHDYTIRAGALFDMTNNTAVITKPVTAVVRTLVAFTDLPETAAKFIAAKAATRFVKTYDGDGPKLASVRDDEQQAYIPFHADHIRNARVNLYQTASMSPILANNWYQRYRIR